jgi:hypothetical protein
VNLQVVAKSRTTRVIGGVARRKGVGKTPDPAGVHGRERRSQMRVKVVRTPGELRDEIGHKIMICKDWTGTVQRRLNDKELAAAGFHPKRWERVYEVLFDDWGQCVAVPAVNLVEIDEDVQSDDGDEPGPSTARRHK